MPDILRRWADEATGSDPRFEPQLDDQSPGHIHPIDPQLAERFGYRAGTGLLIRARRGDTLEVCPLVVHPIGPVHGVLIEGAESPFAMMAGTGRVEIFPSVVVEVYALQSTATARLLEETLERLVQGSESANPEQLGRWRSLIAALYAE